MLPEEKNRPPLGEFSSSRINRLMTCKMYERPAKTLPSIRSLIHLSPYEKIPKHLTATNRTPHKQSPRIREIDRDDEINYNDLSNKLRVRLQFAYYKYRTNQTNQRFKDIRKHSQRREHGTMHNRKSKLPKRKLMVSHGNFKTPAKVSHLIGPQEKDSPVSASASVGERLRFCEAPQDAATITTTMTTTTTITTATPIGKVGKKILHQETPMSVRAAKSLVHLFTSSQH